LRLEASPFTRPDRTIGIPSQFLPRRLLRDDLASLPGPALADWTLEPILPTLGERKNCYREKPEIVAELTETMAKTVAQGRSTPGPRQENDVPVHWRRFLQANPRPDSAAKGTAKL